jgi:hypothetical protein
MAGLSEIRGAPDHVWCVVVVGGRLGEPRRSPKGESLLWTFVGRPGSTADYVECFAVVDENGHDVELSDQIAGYVREDVTTIVDTQMWTRYRKVPFEEARRRHMR